ECTFVTDWDDRLRLTIMWFVLVLLIMSAYAAFAADMTPVDNITICHSSKPPDREWWAWREIDGRRCWYRGSRNKPKSELRWSRAPSSSPVLTPVVEERPGVPVNTPRRYPGAFPLLPFRGSYDAREWWLDATPITEWRVW